jgi:hypothetical protein
MNSPSDSSAVALKELQARIANEIDELRRGVPREFHRAAVVEILRSLDQAQLFTMVTGEWPELWLERVRYGMVRLLTVFVTGAESREFQLGPSSTERAEWASSALVRCGTLALASLLSDYAATDLATLHRTAPDQYTLRILPSDAGVEALERNDIVWGHERIAELQQLDDAELLSMSGEIRDRIARLIQAGKDEIDGYDPVLDDYFESLAVIHAERMLGYDYFPNHALFDGVEFLTYKLAAVVLLRWALSEYYRADVYLELTSESVVGVCARQLVTPVVPHQSVVDMFSEALKVDAATASRITEMFTMDVAFASTGYSAIPAAAVPPITSLGGEDVAVSLHGCVNAPFQFLLARLRTAFPKDWGPAASLNEEVFRNELYSLFPGDRFLCIPRGVKLNHNKCDWTDIDALILDRELGVAGVFQLKWWFAFGSGMRQRSSSAKNLAKEVAEWIRRVQWWLEHYGLDALANQATLKRTDRACLRRIRLFVIGRHFAHFSGHALGEDAVARGTWQQVLRLTTEAPAQPHSIDELWEALRRDSPHLRSRPASGKVEIDVGDFEIVVEASGSGE